MLNCTTIPVITESVILYLSQNNTCTLCFIRGYCIALTSLSPKEKKRGIFILSSSVGGCRPHCPNQGRAAFFLFLFLPNIPPPQKTKKQNTHSNLFGLYIISLSIFFAFLCCVLSVLKAAKTEAAVLWWIQSTNWECHDVVLQLVNIGSQCDGGFQLAALHLPTEQIDLHVSGLFRESQSLAKPLPKQHVCTETRAPS